MTRIYMVGLDGSESSARALEYAAEHAEATGAKLILIHVIDWSAFAIMGPEEVAERHKVREAELAAAEANIIRPAVAAIRAHDTAPQTIIHHGQPAAVMLDQAKQLGVTHLFVGRHGQSRLSALVFGSTTNALVQTSPVPVTVVP